MHYKISQQQFHLRPFKAMLYGCRIVPKCNKNINIKILEMMVEKLNESYKIKAIGTIRG